MSTLVKPVFATWNAPAPTTAAIAAVATGTSLKTMLQVQAPAAAGIVVEAWGFSIDSAVGASSTVELLTTDVAATVTAHVASGVQSFNKVGSVSTVQLGVGGTGYTASAEGTVAAGKVHDAVKLGTTSILWPYNRVFNERERFYIPAAGFLRVRATIGTTGTNMLCWIRWHEGE